MRLLHRLAVLQAVPGSKPQDFGFDTIQVRWIPGAATATKELHTWIAQQDPGLRFLVMFDPPAGGPPFTQEPGRRWYWQWGLSLYLLRRRYGTRLAGVRWNHEYRPAMFTGVGGNRPLERQGRVLRKLQQLQGWLCPGLEFWLYPAGEVRYHSPRQLPEEEYTLPQEELSRVTWEAGFWHSRSPGWRTELLENVSGHQRLAWTIQLDRQVPYDQDAWRECLSWVVQRGRELPLGLWSDWRPDKGQETPAAPIADMLSAWKSLVN